MPYWLITGASRGIGLGVVGDLLKDEKNFVIATARDLTAKCLQDLAANYPKDRLALVGLPHQQRRYQPTAHDFFRGPLFADEFSFNTITIIQVISAFLPLIKKSTVRKIVFITSVLSSLELGGSWPLISNAYSFSKAALNMPAWKWGAVLKFDGVTVAPVHPGWVQTDLGDDIKEWMQAHAKNTPQITTAQSSAAIIDVAKNATLDSTASFYNYDGSKLPF